MGSTGGREIVAPAPEAEANLAVGLCPTNKALCQATSFIFRIFRFQGIRARPIEDNGNATDAIALTIEHVEGYASGTTHGPQLVHGG
jgi:hypothetical protein